MVSQFMKTAAVFGSSGQFGSYAVDYLLALGYRVIACTRRRSDDSLKRLSLAIGHPNLVLETVDILDSGVLNRLLTKYQPDELYHAAAQSHVHLSWHEPYHTGFVTGLGTTNVLEAIRQSSPKTRMWFAGSSEQFGKVLETPQNERTSFNAQSPYAAAKCYAFDMVRIYRQSYGLFTCSSIMFNNESPRRSPQFVTKKITESVARIKLAGGGKVKLGNLCSQRDWGHTKDYVIGAHLMLQQDVPDDFVFATGRTHSIKDFLSLAFGAVGLNWEEHVEIDPALIRPAEVDLLLGDASKARDILGWEPKITFEQLVSEMVQSDMESVVNELKR
jgi:GDPmannose 4,6-dehydratase